MRLRDTSLRRHLESTHGLFIAEGEKVIRRAVEAGYRPRSFLLAERWLPGLSDVLARWPDVPVYVVTEAMAEQVTGFHVHRGALASLHREVRHTVADLLRRRAAGGDRGRRRPHQRRRRPAQRRRAWAGTGRCCRRDAADPLYRRSVKVSMGAVFSLPWARLADWARRPELLRAAGFTTVALTLADGRGRPRRGGGGSCGPAPAKVAILLGHRGCRPVAALDRGGRRPGRHPDAGRHRLAQRGGRLRDRLLRPRPLTGGPCVPG